MREAETDIKDRREEGEGTEEDRLESGLIMGAMDRTELGWPKRGAICGADLRVTEFTWVPS